MSRMLNQNDPEDTRRLLIALLVIGLGLLVWQIAFEMPRQHAMQLQRQEEAQRQQQMEKALETAQVQHKVEDLQRAEQIANSQKKVTIESPELTGAIALQGGRINYLQLNDYHETVDTSSPKVTLLRPSGMAAYFIEFGWLGAESKTLKLPNQHTIWQADNETLTPEAPVTLSWNNGEGLTFETTITLEAAYLFNITQRVVNQSGEAITLHPYGYINRTFEDETSQLFILHEGPLGVLDDSLTEISYEDLIEEGPTTAPNAQGWVGITDKYWLTALIPHNGEESFVGNFKGYITKQGFHRYQADFMGQSIAIKNQGIGEYQSLVFAGAKKLELLDDYSQRYNIPLFDRAVDLGILYFLTKPILMLLTFLHGYVSDFGLAIILLTVLVKAAMYPLANKSYIAMNEMKRLQPLLTSLKERYGNDKMRFQQEMMNLYKREKINPASGCLPLFIQIPVFFALYKVLFVTIEMRHANFYGLIEDLSAKDPSNIFTAFGLLEWTPPSFLHLGIMAILMAVTMWGQQQLNPKPTDPAQAKVMSWLPWIFMVVLASFPAGLLLYWICSNLLSIAQQWSIKTRYNKREAKRAANDS